MTNNFDLIYNLLEFKGKNDFYFIQLIRRPKENPGLKEGKGNQTRCVKSYYIKSKEHLLKVKDEIIELCNIFNARAYIKINYCDERKIGLQMLRQLTEYVLYDDFSGVKRLYDSCCGKYGGDDKERKYWIIDVDFDEESGKCENSTSKQVGKCENIIEVIENKCEPFDKNKVITTIPTKNGLHILTKPFNQMRLKEEIKDFNIDDIKKQALTILYIP